MPTIMLNRCFQLRVPRLSPIKAKRGHVIEVLVSIAMVLNLLCWNISNVTASKKCIPKLSMLY
jgi:hypothetical protein